ncbi:unnamed protein product, partial [Meganyctiphanes norvegica]
MSPTIFCWPFGYKTGHLVQLNIIGRPNAVNIQFWPINITAIVKMVSKITHVQRTLIVSCNSHPQPSEVYHSSNIDPRVGVPASNNQEFTGCGALGFHIKDPNLPVTKLTDCCGGHATCYSSACKVNKRDCDGKLKKCLMAVCSDKTLDKTTGKTCQAAGKLMWSGTMALSFQQYHDAQASIKCKRVNIC